VVVPTLLSVASGDPKGKDNRYLTTQTSQDDPNLTQVEEDSSLDLPQGENWMCFMATSSSTSFLLSSSTQNTNTAQTTPVLASILPWSSLVDKDTHRQPHLLHPGTTTSTTSSFLMLDVDGEHCTIKDIRTHPPIQEQQHQQTHKDDMMQDDQDKEPPGTTHFRISICRRQQTLSLPSTWEHLSFTRQLRHLESGDRLVLWETSNVDDVHCVPSVIDVRCVWEKVYTATVEMTTNNDDDDMMVSQLEDNETYATEHPCTEPQEQQHQQQRHFLFTQASSGGGEASLGGGQLLTQATQFFATQPESAVRLASQIGSTQKTSSPSSHPDNDDMEQEEDEDDDDDDDDDETVDPREGMHAAMEEVQQEEDDINQSEGEVGVVGNNFLSNSPETNRSLRTNLQECLALASALKEEQVTFQTPEKTKPSGGTSGKLRSPDLLNDASSDEEDNENDHDEQKDDNMGNTDTNSVARRVEKEYSPGRKQATFPESNAKSDGKGIASPSSPDHKSRDVTGNEAFVQSANNDVIIVEQKSPLETHSPALPHAGLAEIDEEMDTEAMDGKDQEVSEIMQDDDKAVSSASIPMNTDKPGNLPADRSQTVEATNSTTFFTPRMDEPAGSATEEAVENEQYQTNAEKMSGIGALLTQEDAKESDETDANTFEEIKDVAVDKKSVNGETREEEQSDTSKMVSKTPEDQENQTPEKNDKATAPTEQITAIPSLTDKPSGKPDMENPLSEELPLDPKDMHKPEVQVNNEIQVNTESPEAEDSKSVEKEAADEGVISPTLEDKIDNAPSDSNTMTSRAQSKSDTALLSVERDKPVDGNSMSKNVGHATKKSSPSSSGAINPGTDGVPHNGEEPVDDKAISESVSALVDLSSKSTKATAVTDDARKDTSSPSVLDERRASARVRSTSSKKRKQAATETRSTRSSRRTVNTEESESGTPAKLAKKRKSTRGNASKLSMESREICLMASSDAKLTQKDRAVRTVLVHSTIPHLHMI
jgi:hypothetical protein